ncbi:uncharacterized protein LOC126481939 [Schistocerca serialis cubense]|uniref:uncharacterized protein LOC126481939 n=1 Tax=Schistocerca serialis cubense TaxID=2023355 RepID=UPI00214F2015|nr:uncharacterized protein LOC126481939 [Schistocerca serialis cubense]
MRQPRASHATGAVRPLPLLLLFLAALLAAVGATAHALQDPADPSKSTYWGSDNRLIRGYTDSKGRHYPRLPYYPIDDDDNMDNRISPPSASLYERLPSPPPQRRPQQARRRMRPAGSREGVFRTSGHGSVRIPYPGAHVHVNNDDPSRKMYWGAINASVTPPEQAPLRRYPPEKRSGSGARPCVRCPGSRAVVASRGKRRVLVEQPELSPCPNSPVFPLTELMLDWVHGPKPGTLAEEGDHTVVVRMLYRRRVLQKCRYRYSVVVRRCPVLSLPSTLIANCSMDNVWGSTCDLRCPHGYFLKGHSRIECGDSLMWSHPIPQCEEMSACPMPMSPEHGRLSCKTLGSSPPGTLPEHSVCRYECDDHYTIPDAQHSLMVIECKGGEWNSTADPSCLEMAEKRHSPQVPAKIRRHRRNRRRHRAHRSRIPFPRATAQGLTADPCRPNPCQGGGTCLQGPPYAPVICLCPPHRQGDLCERAQCHNDTCQNGGKCMVIANETACYCPPGYSGSQCQLKDAR